MSEGPDIFGAVLDNDKCEKLDLKDIEILEGPYEVDSTPVNVQVGEERTTGKSVFGSRAHNMAKDVWTDASRVQNPWRYLDELASRFGGTYTNRVYASEETMDLLDDDYSVPARLVFGTEGTVYPVTIEPGDQLRQDVVEAGLAESEDQLPELVQDALSRNQLVVPVLKAVKGDGDLYGEIPYVAVRDPGEQIVTSPDDPALDFGG